MRRTSSEKNTVRIVRIGNQSLRKGELNDICDRIESVFDAECSILDSIVDVPQRAYDSHRKQYNADVVMSVLRSRADEFGADKILAIVDVDLYVPYLNFIFGQSEFPGKVAIVSTHRLKPEFYGLKPNRRLFLERCLKECIHELGHSFGLSHCSNSQCVMFFSNSIVDTDLKGPTFCPKCEATLPTTESK